MEFSRCETTIRSAKILNVETAFCLCATRSRSSFVIPLAD